MHSASGWAQCPQESHARGAFDTLSHGEGLAFSCSRRRSEQCSPAAAGSNLGMQWVRGDVVRLQVREAVGERPVRERLALDRLPRLKHLHIEGPGQGRQAACGRE